MGWNRNYWALAAGCLSMLAVCLLLYGLFDTVLNGVIVDWVENTLMYTYEEFLPSGDYGVIRSVNWDWVKPFLFWALVANGLLWAAALWITYFLARRSKGKEDARQIALRLREAMLSQRDASEIFPPEQQELAAQVAELKARLQSREQKLQQETARKNDLITYLAHDLKTPHLRHRVPEPAGRSAGYAPGPAGKVHPHRLGEVPAAGGAHQRVF